MKFKGGKVNETESSIEYFLINLPESMEGTKKFINALVDSENHDYFETLPIQTIIQYKWEKYTKDFFMKQFCLFLIFFFMNFTDIYYSILYKELNESSDIISDERNALVYVPLKLICSAILLYFCYYEFR